MNESLYGVAIDISPVMQLPDDSLKPWPGEAIPPTHHELSSQRNATVLDLSGAQLELYRSLHNFHERLNVHIKCSTAAAIALEDRTRNSSDPRELGTLIKASHPSWNTPPIHELDLDTYRQLCTSVGAFGIVALFSALDDCMECVEADIARQARNEDAPLPTPNNNTAATCCSVGSLS